MGLVLQPPFAPNSQEAQLSSEASFGSADQVVPCRSDAFRLLGKLRLAAQLAILLAMTCAAAPTVHAQDEPSEESMAAYADAANFQTGGATDLAIDAWKKFLDKYPKHPMAAEAAHYLGVCYMQKDAPDYRAASQAFSKALKNKSYSLREESLANQGWCLYVSAGDGEQRDTALLKRAADVYQTLRKENPDSQFLDRALFYSGEVAYGLQQLDKAVGFYDELLSMPKAKESPLRCDALYARGVAHQELGQNQEALSSYRQLLSSCAEGDLVSDVQLRIGDLMIMEKSYNEAIKAFVSAYTAADTPDDRAYALLRQAFSLVQANRPSEAAAKYEQLIKEFPNSPYTSTAVLASAQSSYRAGDIESAAERFRRVLQHTNMDAATEAAHWLARIEMSKGKPDEAAKIVRRQIDRGLQGDFALDVKLDLAEALSMNGATVGESLKLFEQVYREDPQDQLAPRALYNAAFSALQINQPKRALELALEFIQKFPNDTLVADIRFVAAEAQLSTDNATDAADTYTHLLATTSKDNMQRPVWLLRTGAACNLAGRYSDTIRLLNDELGTLKQPAQRAEAHLLIGQAQLKAGRPAEAAKAFQACQQADPKWARADEAMLLAGQAQMQAGQAGRAESAWQQLISTSPKSRVADQARYKLAQIASDDGKFEQAVGYYDQVLDSRQDPELVPYAQYGKGLALIRLEQYKPAFDSLDQMLRENREHPLRGDAVLARGIASRNMSQLQPARQDLEKFLQGSPSGINLGHALYELALVDQQAKQPAAAAKKLERLVREVPDYPSMDKVLYELGWSLQESGNDDDAVKHFTSLISKFPDAPLVAEAAYFVGQKYYAREQWQQAAKNYTIAASKANDAELGEKIYYRLGWSHFNAADYDAAESAFAEQGKKYANGKLALDAAMMVGECQFKQNKFQPALKSFEAARDKIRAKNESSKTIRDPAERQVRELVFLHGGQSAAQLKSWDLAIQWYDELRRRFPTTEYIPQVFYETGFAYQQKGDQRNALKFFGEVANNFRNELAARARFMIGEIHFAERQYDQAIPEFQRVMFGFGAEKAPASIKNWQAKSGFEAARCSELLMQTAKTRRSRDRSLKLSRDFYTYVVEKHPSHELAAKSRERLEALQK